MTEEQVFLALLDLPDAAARAAYLEEQCGAEGEFRRQVEALLASHLKSGEFLDRPAAEQIGTDSGNLNTVVLARDAMPAGQHDGDEPDALHFLTPSTRPDSLGRIGHYEVLEVLGKGGFGIVLRAFDDVLQRVVAIKVLAPELAVTSPARKRFLREAQSSAKVRHENVVQVYETQEKPLPYLVMEFIPGETLQQRLDRKGPLETAEVLQIGRQIAAGLAAAHATGLIHRDIKPGNILIEAGANEQVKLTDFGLARAADDASMTQSGVVAGTPTFMAPEQARGESLDHRADLFSLGSVLYTMCSGRPPFRAATTFAVLKRVVEDEPRPIRELIPETPEWLCGIIARLHAKDPAERFQSAREVADLLADCEAKLKSQREIETILPTPAAERPTLAEPREGPEMRPLMVPVGIRWPLLIATGIMFLLTAILLAVTESTGLTHLFSGVADVTSPPVPPRPEEPGWVQLFNGQDLTGWKTSPEAPGHWEVKEGVLIGSQRRSHLYSERGDYANFHLRVEAKVNLGGDSGVLFRTDYGTQANDGYEVEIHKNLTYGRKTGTVEAGQTDGPPLVLGLSADDSLTRPDEWFTLEIIAQRDRFITKVNGIETAHCIDPTSPRLRGHLGLQVWNPNTVVQFRKVEIKELPSSAAPPSGLAKRRFGSDEWIDVIPLIDPALDKWNFPQRTGKNAWRKEQDELVVVGDALGSKLLLPLDSDFPAFECELEFTRRAGNSGLILNLPAKLGECHLLFNTFGAWLGSRRKALVLNGGARLTNGQRAAVRVLVCRQQDADQVSVSLNGANIGEWTGDRSLIADTVKEGFPPDRRLSLWIQPGGNEFVFHRIRVRMLDGGTAETLRPVPPATPAAAAETGWAPLFNGQNTIGWKLHPNQGGGWHVLGGEMIGQGAPVNHLFTDRGDYEDFHLRAKVKLDADTMAAVCLRTEFGLSDMDKYPRGYAVLLQNYGEIRTGSLLGLTDFKEPLVKHGEWFTLEVIARGPQLTVKVNGQTTADFADSQHAYRRGHIALRAIGPPQHGGVYVEKIEIKELAPEEPGFVPLFNGQDLAGWKSDLPGDTTWTWAEGVLTFKGLGDLLVTERNDYENYHLRMTIKNKPGSSVWIRLRDADGDRYLTTIRPVPGSDKLMGGGLSVFHGQKQAGLATNDDVGPADEWHTLEVIAVGDRFQTFVDGKPVADVTDPDRTSMRGRIALSLLGRTPQEVHFKNVEIKELAAAASRDVPPPASPATADSKLVPLRSFTPGKDKLPIALRPNGKKVVTVEGDSWRIENSGQQGNFHVMIAQVLDDIPLDGVLAFRAKVRVETKHELAWGSLGFGGANHRFIDWDQWPDALSYYDAQDSEWAEKEVRHPVAECRKSDPPAIYLYAGFHADGVIWLKDVELLHLPAVPGAMREPPPATFKNGIGMEFVKVPKGKSWLGGSKEKPGDQEVEIPADFYLGKHEVTQEDWEKVMGENPSHFSRAGGGKDAVKDISDADRKRFPVENVSWEDCQRFVTKLNEREREPGWTYRLPKEAEWEYACRGGPNADKLQSAFDFCFAEPTNTLLVAQANFKDSALNRTCKVGCYVPNRLGLFDMHGNVWEWCDDLTKVADESLRRVDRGGSWGNDADQCRAAVRFAGRESSSRYSRGLRMARVPSSVPSPEAAAPPRP